MMTPRSRKPVLLLSGTNINNLPKLELKDCEIDSVKEETSSISLEQSNTTNQQEDNDKSECSAGLTTTFREYLHSRSIITNSPTDLSFSSCTDDYCSDELNASQMSSSLLHCLNGFTPPPVLLNVTAEKTEENTEKELVLKPKQFDDDGKPIVFETSF